MSSVARRLVVLACLLFGTAAGIHRFPETSFADVTNHSEIIAQHNARAVTANIALPTNRKSTIAATSATPSGTVPLGSSIGDERASMDELNRRIDDLKDRIGDINLWLGGFTIILTVVGAVSGIVIGLVAYFTAGQRATASAERWMNDHADALQRQISTLEEQVKEALGTVERAKAHALAAEKGANEAATVTEVAAQRGQIFLARLRDAEASVQQALDGFALSSATNQEGIAAADNRTVPSEQKRVLDAAEESLRDIPEAQYSAEDWGQRAFTAYANRDLGAAASYFDNAANVANASDEERARFRVNSAIVLTELGQLEEALSSYDAVINTFDRCREPEVAFQVAKAATNKTHVLGEAGRLEEAIARCEAVVSEYGSDPQNQFADMVSLANRNKGIFLERLGHHDQALKIWLNLIETFGGSQDETIQEHVAIALRHLSLNKTTLGDDADALAPLEELISRYADSSKYKTSVLVSKALVDRGRWFERNGRLDDAIASFNEAIVRSESGADGVSRGIMARASLYKARAFANHQHSDDAIKAYRGFVSRFASDDEADGELRVFIAEAFSDLAAELAKRGRQMEALETYERLIDNLGVDRDPAIQLAIARALRRKGEYLREVGRTEESQAAYRELLSRFESVEDAQLQQEVALARQRSS